MKREKIVYESIKMKNDENVMKAIMNVRETSENEMFHNCVSEMSKF
jgi:hypothetical protein